MKTPNTMARRRLGRQASPGRQVSCPPVGLALRRLRARLLRRELAKTDNPVLQAGLHRAAAEAESLAWLTPCPMLVLPTLLEEKAREARLYATRQAGIREASREWLSLAE